MLINASKIDEILKERGMTRKELAEAIGTSYHGIMGVFRRSACLPATMEKIVSALGINESDICVAVKELAGRSVVQFLHDEGGELKILADMRGVTQVQKSAAANVIKFNSIMDILAVDDSMKRIIRDAVKDIAEDMYMAGMEEGSIQATTKEGEKDEGFDARGMAQILTIKEIRG